MVIILFLFIRSDKFHNFWRKRTHVFCGNLCHSSFQHICQIKTSIFQLYKYASFSLKEEVKNDGGGMHHEKYKKNLSLELEGNIQVDGQQELIQYMYR